MKALIDGDILKYKLGFASEKRMYHVYLKEDKDFGPIYSDKYKKNINEFVESMELIDDVVVEQDTTPEPVEYALYLVNDRINQILNDVEADEYATYLSPPKCFRNDLFPDYKGNRKSSKPYHYQAITDHLISKHGAVTCDGIEADDALGIEQIGYYDNTIICTIDKDLDMIPGWHYNLDSREKYFITDTDAIRNFYKQLLTGDRTDNIPGIYGIDKKIANKMLDDITSEEEMYKVVSNAWMDYDEMVGLERMEQSAHLLWILREPNKRWEPPIG